MRFQRRGAVLVFLVAPLLTLLACGEDTDGTRASPSEAGTSTTTAAAESPANPLTKEEFIEQADRVCKRSQSSAMPLETRFNEAIARGDLGAAATTLRQGLQLTKRFAAELRALVPPPEDVDLIERWISVGESRVALGRRLADAIEAEDETTATRLGLAYQARALKTSELAKNYGLKTCGDLSISQDRPGLSSHET
jgi:hypothetical protein